MVTGACKQIVNGEVVTLNAGDILLMDSYFTIILSQSESLYKYET